MEPLTKIEWNAEEDLYNVLVNYDGTWENVAVLSISQLESLQSSVDAALKAVGE